MKKNMIELSNNKKTRFAGIPDIIGRHVGECIKKKKKGGLLLISIDNLHMIINSHGTEFVEELMPDIKEQISKNIKSGSIVERVDKSHFAVFIPDISQNKLEIIAIELYKHIQSYGCTLCSMPIHIITTIGGVDIHKYVDSVDDIFDKAFVALNDAHETYSHYMVYGNKKKHEIESKNQLILANYIQTALLDNRLRLAYQPIIDRATGDIAFHECLLRIVGEDGTTSSAGPFIPVAEKMGFIDLIDSFVMQLVIKELTINKELKLAFNLSNVTIQNKDWLTMAIKMLSKIPDIAKRMILEITETGEYNHIKRVKLFATSMKEIGCKIALDDFGAGNTSFSHVRNLPIDIIKIDGSYIRDMAYNNENRMFVKTILDFTHNLKKKAIAEFVENMDIANLLTDMGVDYMQGNYFSPAVNYRSWAQG